MKNKFWRRTLCTVLALAMCLSAVPGAAALESAATYEDPSGAYLGTKLSHPNSPVKTTDGLVDYIGGGTVSAVDQGQGDRGQNYSWAAIEYGNYMYIATCYNAMGNTLNLMKSALGDNFDPEVMTATLNVLFNGDFFVGEEDDGSTGGVLIKMDVTTGDVTLLMSKNTTQESCLFRNVCAYNGKLYFCGAVNNLPCIYQVDPANDECKMVYQGMTREDYIAGYVAHVCTGIRGLCEFNGELIVSCVTKDGPQILSSTDPEQGFTQIADQQDLFDYPAYHYEDSIYGGSIWEMVNFNGRLYVSVCTGTPDNKPDAHTMQSFALVRGDKQADGSWTWTSVIGDKERDGAKYTFGIDPQRTRAGAGVLTLYDGYLYIGEYNDEEIALEDVLFNLDLTFVNENLKQSVNLYRMDENENIELVVGDPTDMFPEGGISGIGSGFDRHENQYIWRMTEYGGKLYVGTFDTSSLLQPIGQFTNGDFFRMTKEERARLFEFIRILLELQKKGDAQPDNAVESKSNPDVDALTELFARYSDEELTDMVLSAESEAIHADDPNAVQLPTPDGLEKLLELIKGILTCGAYMGRATRGFDLYVSEDGVNFETITINGFGDPYNHGLRVFASTDAGLCIGTANPFYGTQIWMLDEVTTEVEDFTSNLDVDFDSAVTDYTVETTTQTKEFSFTMRPKNRGNTILVNGEATHGYSASVPLQEGENVVTVTNRDVAGNSVTYTFTILVASDKNLYLKDGLTGERLGVLMEEEVAALDVTKLAETLDCLTKTVDGVTYTFAGWFTEPQSGFENWTEKSVKNTALEANGSSIYAWYIDAGYLDTTIAYTSNASRASRVYALSTAPADIFSKYGFVLSTANSANDENLVIGATIDGLNAARVEKTTVYTYISAAPFSKNAPKTANALNGNLGGVYKDGTDGYISYALITNMPVGKTVSARAYYVTLDGTVVYGATAKQLLNANSNVTGLN